MPCFFRRFGRQWRVFLQAEGQERTSPESISQFYVRNNDGDMLPLSTVVTSRRVFGPEYTKRFNLFRAVQTILVILLLGFGAPSLQIRGVPHSDIFWAIVALVLVYSAYVAEVYRAGIQSVHPSQVASAPALGLSRGKTMRFVVVPQAVRRVLPPLLNDFIGLQKDSALVAVLWYTDALRQVQIISAAEFDFTPYVSLALVYIVITIPEARFVDWLVARDQHRRQAAGGV